MNQLERHLGQHYKLAGNEQFAIDVLFPDQLDIDESKMAVTIFFADGNRRDGVGDVTEVGGIRLERHKKNPIVLFDHGKEEKLPIALSEDPDTHEYTVVIDPQNRQAYGKAFFYQGTGLNSIGLNTDIDNLQESLKQKEYEHALFCEQLFHMISKRFIRAGSFAYQVVKALNLQPDYSNGQPAGLHLLETILLEFGPTVLPANQDTVRKMLAMPEVCGKPLSPVLVKSLTPYAPAKVAQMGYEGKKAYTTVVVTSKPDALRQACDQVGVLCKPRGQAQLSGDFTGYTFQLEGDETQVENLANQFHRKSIEPVPLDEDLSKTDVPPARWKPGEGAEKTVGNGPFKALPDPSASPQEPSWVVVDKDGAVVASGFKSKAAAEEEVKKKNIGKGIKSQPSDDISPAKAREILKDGTVHGKPLTEDQRRMFGAAASKSAPDPSLWTKVECDRWVEEQRAKIKMATGDLKLAVRMRDSELINKRTRELEQLKSEMQEFLANEGRKGIDSVQFRWNENPSGTDWERRKLWVRENGSERQMTFPELATQVGHMEAQRLIKLSIRKGTNRWHSANESYSPSEDEGYKALRRKYSSMRDLSFQIKSLKQGQKAVEKFKVGDEVTVLVGSFKGDSGKVLEVMFDGLYYRVQVVGGQVIRYDGNEIARKKSLQSDGEKAGRSGMLDAVYRAAGGLRGGISQTRTGLDYVEGYIFENEYDAFKRALAKEGYDLQAQGRRFRNAGDEDPTNEISVKITSNPMYSEYTGKGLKSLEIKNLRQKYRTVKGLRRRLRKGMASKASLYISGKDIDKARELAKEKGLKFALIGTHSSGNEKVTLSGDDKAIDEMAKQFGKTIKWTRGSKSMPNEITREVKSAPEGLEGVGQKGADYIFKDKDGWTIGTDGAGKYYVDDENDRTQAGPFNSLQEAKQWLKGNTAKSLSGAKAMPDEIEDTEEGKTMEGTPREEKLGAQVLRRLHKDHALLMKDYDEMIGPLENERVKARLQKKLEDMEGELSEYEEMFTKEFGEDGYDPIEGTMDKGDDDLDVEQKDDSVPDSSGDDLEEPTGEEAVEGMQAKNLRTKYRKSKEDEKKEEEKTLKSRKKQLCPDCGKEPCVCKKSLLKGRKAAPGYEEHQDKPGSTTGSLVSHEKAAVGEAAGYLKDLAQPNSQLDEEGRMKAYHYHKTLDGIGQVEELAGKDFDPMDAAEGEVNVSGAAKEMPDGYQKDATTDEEGLKSHRKMCKAASGFFKELSTTKDFGEPHRAKSMAWHKVLAPLAEMDAAQDEVNMNDPPQKSEPEPGEMGEKAQDEEEKEEKGLGGLKNLYKKNAKSMEELSRKMAQLLTR